MAQMAEMQPPDAMETDGAASAFDDSYEGLMQLGEQLGDAEAGLSGDELTRLGIRRLDEAPADEARCSICCCEFVKGDKLLSLRCGHDYHPECIGTWLRSKRTCPMCKRDVLS